MRGRRLTAIAIASAVDISESGTVPHSLPRAEGWVNESPPEEDLSNEVAKIAWYHRIDLGAGVITPGVADPNNVLPHLGMPEDLSGKTVLDIGAWDGFYSFEAERRGASRVLATDWFCWGGGGWGSKAGFELARRALGSKVEDREIDVLDIRPETVGVFDVVLFLGVLYHMRHPLLALERVASVTEELLIVETHVDMLSCARPAAAFYPGADLADDATNWWGPNPAAVMAMLESVGFRDVGGARVYAMSPPAADPPVGRLSGLADRLQLRRRRPPRADPRTGRLVVHARR